MKNHSNKKVLNFFSGLSIFVFVLFTFSVYVLKSSYAIPLDDNGIPTSTFTSNYSGNSSSLKNYIEDALGSSYQHRKFFRNFSVVNDYRTNDNTTPLYLLVKNSKIPRTTESFEITENNPTSVDDNGIKYILAHGYNTINTNDIFSTGTYGPVTNNNIKHYVTQIALWLYLLQNKSSFASSYCSNVNIHLKDSDTTPAAFESMGGCEFYSVAESGDSNYTVDTATATIVETMISDAAKKSGYNYLNYILDLVKEANKYRSISDSSVGITLTSTDSLNYTIASDGNSLITEAITPSVTNPNFPYLYYSIQVEDPNEYGAYITDINGKKISDVTNMSGSFRIYVPIVNDMDLTSIKIKVVGTFLRLDANSYHVTKSTSSDPVFDSKSKELKFSDVLLGYVPTTTADSTLVLKNLTKISKIDATNSKELPGATLVIKKKDSNEELYKWVSGNNPRYFYLADGDYTLCETTAPKGFDITECINFTVNGSKTTSVIMKNSPSVEVPNTGLFSSNLPYIIGGIILVLGIGVIGATLYKRKNN